MNHSTGLAGRLRVLCLLLAWLAGLTGLLPLPGTPLTDGARAQVLFNAENGGMGGGGTAYLTGIDAHFINPANLHLGGGNLDLSLGGGAVLLEPVYRPDGLRGWGEYLAESLLPYEAGSRPMDSELWRHILETQYPNGRAVAQNLYRQEASLLGIRWRGENGSFSLAIRARQGTRIESGRGWYSTKFTGEVRDFTLRQQKETLYELSAGFAREFGFINGLFAGTERLFVGFAPKFALGGGYADLHYDGRYHDTARSLTSSFSYEFRQSSTGDYSRLTRNYLSTGQVAPSIDRSLDPASSFRPTGWGMGMDFGLTYVISFGHPPEADGAYSEPDRVLYVGLSVTDLGFMRYTDTPLTLENSAPETPLEPQGISTSVFTGGDGQFLEHIDGVTQIPNPLRAPGEISTGGFTRPLPTSLNGGVMLKVGRLRLSGDLSMGLDNTAFNTTQLTAHLGTQLQLLSFLPLRAGTQLAAGRPTQWMLGTGIDGGAVDLSVSARFLGRSGRGAPVFGGAAFGGIRYRF